jgi:hypothetical protein
MRNIASILVAFSAFGCAPTDDPGFTSVTTSGGTGDTGEMGDAGSTGEPPEPQICADPEFDENVPEEPTVSECAGQGGGALVFDVFTGFGNGVIRDKSKASPTVLFPDDTDVGACCGAAAKPSEVAGACVSDCARAACNLAIATLEDAVANPSSLQGNGCGKNCAKNLAASMADWVLPQLESWTGYNSCLTMAELNNDSNVDYTAAQIAGQEFAFKRPSDACKDFGCLSNVRLRLYCAVDSVVPSDQMCMMASNDEHPDIPESERYLVASSPTDITSTSNGHAEAHRATSHGGALRQDDCDDSACPLVLETFSLSTDEIVNFGPLRAWDLTATLEYAAIGVRVGDTVEFDPGALQFRISGVSSPEDEKLEMPLDFVIVNTSPAMATFTGSTFSFEELAFRQGEDELQVRVHEASATPVE